MFKKLISIDKNPIIVNFAQTVLGKILFIALFYLFIEVVPLYPADWKQAIFICVTFITFFPRFRYIGLFAGMYCLLVKGLLNGDQPDWVTFRVNYLLLDFEDDSAVYISSTYIRFFNVLLVLISSELLIYLLKRYRQYKIFHYPLTILYGLLFLAVFVAEYFSWTPLQRLCIWSFIVIYLHYFWFVAYTLLEAKLEIPRNFLLDYGRYLPIWGFTALPYGKGSVYLRHVEAKNEEEFAVTRLKAIKLGCWSMILSGFMVLQTKMELYFQIPDLRSALSYYNQGGYYSVQDGWMFLLNRYFKLMLSLAVTSHLVVATCRMCGFRILRNMYNPLASQTVAEYWNRYNYYFKELLAEFFFYPAYFRFFKNWPKIRVFFGILSAATFGNILFHLFLMAPLMISAGFVKTMGGFIPFCLYAVVLGITIGISQLRHIKSDCRRGRFHMFVVSPLFVIFFYSILCLFNGVYQAENVTVNFRILGSLFGLRW